MGGWASSAPPSRPPSAQLYGSQPSSGVFAYVAGSFVGFLLVVLVVAGLVLQVHELEDTSTRNLREALVVKKRRTPSLFHRVHYAHENDKEGRQKAREISCMTAAHHVVPHERSNVFGNANHVLEGARSPMCAPQKPEGDAHGAGNKDI